MGDVRDFELLGAVIDQQGLRDDHQGYIDSRQLDRTGAASWSAASATTRSAGSSSRP
jgi:hypothetical protein